MPDDCPTIGLRVVESLSAVDAEQWDACALAPGSAGNPFLSHALPEGAGGFQVGRPAHRLAAAIPAGRDRRRHPAGRRPALCEGPQPGRIRLRPWLGAGLRARRRPLLSQAPGRRAVHAGARPAPVRAPRPLRRRRARRHDRHAGQDRRRQPHQLGPRHLLHRGRLEALRRARLAAAAGPAVSLAQRRLRQLRRFPGGAGLAQAQGDPQGARGGAARGPDRARALRRRDQARALGRLLRLLHGHRRPQVGLALSHALLLRHPGRAPWPTRSCW